MTNPEEFNPILAVPKGLPPGLWLPTAEEPTEKYLAKNFIHLDHDFEDLVDLGAFAVALLVWDASDSNRVSFMPQRADFIALYNAGYGLSPSMMRNLKGVAEDQRSVTELQKALGFYPAKDKSGESPTKTEIMDRLQWLSQYSLDIEAEFPGRVPQAREVMEWGRARNLLPARVAVEQALGSNHVPIIRDMFGLEIPRYREQNTHHDIYKIGARVISEKGQAIKGTDLDQEYGDLAIGSPTKAITTIFGSYGSFWAEFGQYADVRWMTRQDLINVGIREAIKTGKPYKPWGEMTSLSARSLFPNPRKIVKCFDPPSIIPYQEKVAEGFAQYEALRDTLSENGVSREVCRLACQRLFEPTEDFSLRLKIHSDVLAILSDGSYDAKYVGRLIQNGLNLLDDEIFGMQLKDLNKALRNLGLTDEQERRFVFDLIPRFDTDEMMHA